MLQEYRMQDKWKVVLVVKGDEFFVVSDHKGKMGTLDTT